MTSRVTCMLALALALCSCGDDIPHEPRFEATSGTRLALHRYLYEDGARQVDGSAFYDKRLHERCAPGTWSDDTLRCIPQVDDAAYVDAQCAMVIGINRSPDTGEPAYFLGYDTIEGARLPARLYRAGARTTAPTAIWEMRDGTCTGPLSVPSSLEFYQVVAELGASEVVTFHDRELGDGRLGLRVRETDDGLQIALGLRDRHLDLECTPVTRSTGTACEPTTAPLALHYQDPACEVPVAVVNVAVPIPTVARVNEADGCASYRAVGQELAVPLYRRDGGRCAPFTLAPTARAFAVGEPRELAALERTVDDVPGLRLQQVVMSASTLRFVGERLVDTATRTECHPVVMGDDTRCIPTTLASAMTLFTRDCSLPIRVTQVPTRTCGETFAFAFAPNIEDSGFDLHEVGDRAATPLFSLASGECVQHVDAVGSETRLLGPPLAPETFARGLPYGER